ncbi:MAG: hypothetical protein JSR41_07640 [Proteobacteria bacterium]|nr:hypothetical protein [Pseudomonadota bacterium]
MPEELPDVEARRGTSNPIAEAGSVLGALIELWSEWFPEQDFLQKFFKPMWDDEKTSGSDQVDQIREIEELKDWNGAPITAAERDAFVKIALLMAACAFAVQAMKAPKNSSAAWTYAIDASRWLGILQGFHSGVGRGTAASELARRGADAAHAENRAMKALVIQWCDDNMAAFRSMDAAAQAIAGTLVPVTFRTARDWIGAWKKLRSAGKP